MLSDIQSKLNHKLSLTFIRCLETHNMHLHELVYSNSALESSLGWARPQCFRQRLLHEPGRCKQAEAVIGQCSPFNGPRDWGIRDHMSSLAWEDRQQMVQSSDPSWGHNLRWYVSCFQRIIHRTEEKKGTGVRISSHLHLWDRKSVV